MRKTLVTFTIAISLGFSGTIANAQEAAPAGPAAQVADSTVVAEAEAAPAPAPSQDAVATEVSAALVGLGWSEAQAAKAIEKLAGSGLGASDMLRAALVALGGGRG